MLNESRNLTTPGYLIDDRFEVVGLIGAGAMGTVIHCKDTSLKNSDVVLKFLKPEYTENKKQFDRFKNEALLMRGLNHPNVVHVYDLRSTSSSSSYITMEYIEGSSIKALMGDLRDNHFPFADALKILKDIASGMNYAHKKGIIHRDLKPDNVLISKDGEIKLTDFGVGQTLVSPESITDLDTAIGTPHYMSPEQIKGIKVDHRCDIYSFGIMAYELVTGQKPYNQPTYMKLAEEHLNSSLPKISDSNIPSWYNNFLNKCCDKNKDKRFQSFEQVLEFIEKSKNKKSRKKSYLKKALVCTSMFALLASLLYFSSLVELRFKSKQSNSNSTMSKVQTRLK